MHPWSKDCGCPFARVGTTSIRSSRGPKRPAGLKGPAPGSLSPKPSSRRQTLGRCTRSPPVKRGRRRGPSPGFPAWEPEPSRAQLLQGRAAIHSDCDSKLPLALGFAYRLSPASRTGPRVQAWKTLWCACSRPNPVSAKSALAVDAPFRRAVPRDTSPCGGLSMGDVLFKARVPCEGETPYQSGKPCPIPESSLERGSAARSFCERGRRSSSNA